MEAADATKPELDIADVFTATSLVKDRKKLEDAAWLLRPPWPPNRLTPSFRVEAAPRRAQNTRGAAVEARATTAEP